MVINMNDNNNLKKLIVKTMDETNSLIPDDLSEELMNLLAEATFICPVMHEMIMPIEVGKVPFLPVFTSLDDFKEVFVNMEYETFKFRDLLGHFKFFMQGIIINPQILCFSLKKDLSTWSFIGYGMMKNRQ